jgi:predicted permease
MLRWLTEASLADSIAGDLEEQRRRRATTSRPAAAVWFWRALLSVIAYFVRQQVISGVRALLSRAPRFNRGSVWRQASRSLRQRPWYAAAATAVIALTIALAATVFAVVDATLFKPLPYERPAELHFVSGGYSDEILSAPGVIIRNTSGLGLSVRDMDDIVAAVPGATFAAYGRGSGGTAPLGSLLPWTPRVGYVGERLFDVLGVHPLIGGFTPADFEAAATGTIPVLISYDTWQSTFGGRPDVLNQMLAGTPPVTYRVAGVMPAAFVFPARGPAPHVLRPLVITSAEKADRYKRTKYFVMRLPSGVPLSEYRKRFEPVARAAAAELPDVPKQGGAGATDVFAVMPFEEQLSGRDRSTLLLVFGMAAALVLLGCANVSGLAASRQLDAARQLALRRALGAAAGDISALVLAESAVVVLVGATIGVLATFPALSLVRTLLPATLILGDAPAMSWRLVAFAALASGLCVLAVSLWPVRRALAQPIAPALTANAQTMSPAKSTGRFIVVAAQVGLGLVLTLAGAQLVGSLVRVWSGELGYSADGVVTIELAVDGASVHERATAIDTFLQHVRQWPGVESAGATDALLLRDSSPGGMVGFSDYPITPGFIETLQPKLVSGRWPNAEEFAAGTPVAVLTPEAANKLFPEQSAVGQSITTRSGPFVVIGIAAPAMYSAWDGLRKFPGFQSYVPYRAVSRRNTATIVLRAGRQDRAVVSRVMREAEMFRSPIRVTAVATAEDLLTDTIRPRRFQAWLFGSFGVAALAIVGAGLLGLLAMATARRRREVGIRVALGATHHGVVRLFLREQLAAVLVGVVAGCLVSVWTAGLASSLLYDITAYDLRVWAAAVIAMLAMSMLGVLVPSWRVSRVDPVQALRVD